MNDFSPSLALLEMAMDEVRPYLYSHGGDVDIVEVKNCRLYIKFKGTCVGCPISLYTLKLGIEEIIKKHVPEIIEVIAITD